MALDSENSDDTTALNRDTEHTEKDLFTVDRKQGDFDVTVDHRLLTEEGRAQIKEDVKRTHLAGQSLADVATEDSVTLADTFEHMDVVQKELDIQKKIALENPEAAQILNNLDLANAEAKQYATEVYLQTYADVMGITIDEARVVAFKGGAKGNHLVQNGKTTVELNDAETTNGADAANTIVHEGTHAAINQGRIGDKGEFEEQYTKLVGNYAEDTFKFVLDNYKLGDYKSGDVNNHVGNDSSSVIQNNNLKSVISHLTTPKDQIDNRLPNTNERYAIQEITNQIAEKTGQDAKVVERSVLASACYKINCSKGLAIGSEERAYYQELEKEGAQQQKLQDLLTGYEGTRTEENSGVDYPKIKTVKMDNLFGYDKSDAYSDSEAEALENYFANVAEQTGEDIATVRTAYATAATFAVVASVGKSKVKNKLFGGGKGVFRDKNSSDNSKVANAGSSGKNATSSEEKTSLSVDTSLNTDISTKNLTTLSEVKVAAFNPYQGKAYQQMTNAEKKNYLKEYNRQLKRQQDAINDMSAEEFVLAREKYTELKRNPEALKMQKDFRTSFKSQVSRSIYQSLQVKNKQLPSEQRVSAKELKAVAKERANKISENLAALHEPDMVAGGWHKETPSAMGDATVNKSIGGSWSSARINAIEGAAKKAIENGQGSSKMNVKLEVSRGG